jgi:hypothetical protein
MGRRLRRRGISPEQGAATPIYLASAAGVEGVSGGYFVESRPGEMAAPARDGEAARRLWSLSERMIE